jgi:hypothetical protein
MLAMQLLLRRLIETAMEWNRLFDVARNPYRPELHYMRGPGPKWHAKHPLSMHRAD